MEKCVCCGEEAHHHLKGDAYCNECYREMMKRGLTAAFEADCF